MGLGIFEGWEVPVNILMVVTVRLVERRFNRCLLLGVGGLLGLSNWKTFDKIVLRSFLKKGDRNVFGNFILMKPRVGLDRLDPQTFVFIFHQETFDEVLSVLRQCVVLREAVFYLRDVLVQLLQCFSMRAERTLAHGQEVHNDTESPDVRRERVTLLDLELLGSHVIWRSTLVHGPVILVI